MAPRLLALAAAACLTAGACGGADEPGPQAPAGEAAAAAEPPATTGDSRTTAGGDGDDEGRRPRRESDERSEPEPGDDAAAAAEDEREQPPRRRQRSDRRRGDGSQAEVDVQRVVRRIVGMISAADKRVCRRSFTRRYAEFVSGQRGDAAFRRCESDVGRSKGTLEVVDFQETRLNGASAAVRFRMRVPGAVTRQGWRLVRRGGDWLVDAKL